MWFTAAVFYPLTLWASGAGKIIIAHILYQSLLISLITATAAFFLLEHVLQKKLVPIFYPSGGLSMTPNTLRIRIRTRLFALLTSCNLIPFLAVLIILTGTYRLSLDPAQILDLFRSTIFTNALVFMWIGISLTFIVSSNLTRPIEDITSVLKRVRDGYLDRKVRVTSNDEIGYTGDVINEMTEGLKERERMRQSLELAMEIQRSLLPRANPTFKGFDIAGVSIYCDETGGDYFDYLDTCENEQGETAVVVGDVSGHGIPSALLMATARAFLRLRSSLPGNMSTIIADVNRQLTHDVEGSGQFMSLFYLVLEPATRKLRWIRAGHDPAILYNPATDTFEELKGDGMVLGINEDWVFQENERVGLETGQILFLGTDGIWEAHNSQGDMFGKDAVRNIIRQNANASAAEIQEAILGSLRSFQGDVDPEDDVTMVVIKVLEDV
jgi:sigma-B regulation protein RsbU (phosphoserine phosphatase)